MRHAFNSAVSYEIPTFFSDGIAKKIFGGFGVDAIFRARTTTPINLVSGVNSLDLGVTTILRPDLVPGQPIYIDDRSAQGGRRFNRAAFNRAAPIAQGRQGTLGRNVLRGFGANQLDLSVRRQFNFSENVNLLARADGFNIFNRANFANPSGVVPAVRSENNPYDALDPNAANINRFGRSLQTLGAALGGLASIYQIGGPRSFQLSAKLRF